LTLINYINAHHPKIPGLTDDSNNLGL
jgi:hypothetical protein